jgi:hypothetical protein
MTFFALLLYVLSASLPATALKLWQQAADLPLNIPVSCRAGLTTNITCGPSFVSVANVEGGLPYDSNFLNQYCTSGCSSSLKVFLLAKTSSDLNADFPN